VRASALRIVTVEQLRHYSGRVRTSIRENSSMRRLWRRALRARAVGHVQEPYPAETTDPANADRWKKLGCPHGGPIYILKEEN
jgi:hypothetical protein